MSNARPPRTTTPLWTSLVQYYRACLSREQELGLTAPSDPGARVLLPTIEEHLLTRKAATTILANPAHTQPILNYLNRRGRGIGGSFIYGYPLARVGERLYPLCYTEVRLEPGTAPQTVVLTRGANELLFNRQFLRFTAGLTDAEIGELQRAWLSTRGGEPAAILSEYLVDVDLHYDAVLFAAESRGGGRGPARELQLMEQLRKDRLPDAIRIFTGEQGLPAAREAADYLAILPPSAEQVKVLKRWRAPFLAVAGPAGSGKSRTAANLIATAAAEWQRVLYVSRDGHLPAELVEAFPGILHIGSKANWTAALRRALEVIQALREGEEEPAADAEGLAAESRRLGQELDRLQAEQEQASALAAQAAGLEPVSSRLESALAHHPQRSWMEALAGRITPATAAQLRPEQLVALRELHVRALGWEEEGGIGGRLKEMRRVGQIKAALRQAGVPDFCHPEGDLQAQIAGLGLLVQAYPLLLVRARLLQAQAAVAGRGAEAAGAAAAASRKAAVDRQRLRLAWQQRAQRIRANLDQIEASVKAEIEALEGDGPQRSVVSRQRFSDLLAAFPVVVSPHLAVAGIVPNEPEMFDLLILDDADQAQIPAFLPVLYRAKRAVLLGDEAGAVPSSCLGSDEDSRLLGQVEEHNLAPFAYTEVTPLHRALAVASAQALRLRTRYGRAGEEAQFVNVADGQTLYPAPAAISQAQNPLEARAALLQVTRLLNDGLTEVALFTPFSGQARLFRQLLDRLSQAERNPDRAAALRRIPVHTADGATGRHQGVVISLVLAQGATPESVRWLQEQRRQLEQMLGCATERAVVVGRRETVGSALPGTDGGPAAPSPGLRPERLGLLPAERELHQAFLCVPGAVADGLEGAARELHQRLASALRGRGALLAPRLSLATALEPERLVALSEGDRKAAAEAHPLMTVIDGESLRAVAVVELDEGAPGPVAAICQRSGLRYLRVRPGDWERLRELQG